MNIKKLFTVRTSLLAMIGIVIAAVIALSGLGEAALFADKPVGSGTTATLAFVKTFLSLVAGYGPTLLLIGLGLAVALGLVVGLVVLILLGSAALARVVIPAKSTVPDGRAGSASGPKGIG
jgi:hypothetical protein